jgi:hypothetical protein
MKGNRYRKVIQMYIESAKTDLEEAKTKQEKILSIYLMRELVSIINDVENRGLGK